MKNFYIVSVGPRGHKTYEVRRRGSGRMEHYTDSRREAEMYARKLQREENARDNPSRRLTKAQRKAKSAKASKLRRISKALQNYLKQVNPSCKYAGAQVKKNKGGSITIIPVKLPKR